MTSVQTGAAQDASIWEKLKQEIKAAGPGLGIDDIGFASADPFVSLKSLLEQSRDKGYASGFEEPDIEKRVHPALKDGEACFTHCNSRGIPIQNGQSAEIRAWCVSGIFARPLGVRIIIRSCVQRWTSWSIL